MKILKESNKKFKKNIHVNTDAGDVEKSIDVFNNSMNPVCEDFEELEYTIDLNRINNILDEHEELMRNLNNDQLKAIRVIKHKYPYVNITAKNMPNGCARIVIDSKEFNPNTAIEKINAIINDIDKLIGMNYRIKYEKPLKSTELNYQGYSLYRLVISLEPHSDTLEKDEIEDIFYNNETGYWELNGKEFVNYEDALKYI